ncbi:type 1 glutamine amidotransferase-like domain-containing protein [Candidatus Roizmanbacteria bacterium]|nr:type 1 glutamine amidotransferase-like domain-containing protein [Candidatus Roizmanbacteria bacterium]
MKIVAIGGGEIGRPGFPVETTKIDKEIIVLTGKKNPKLLFLPTASSDSDKYVNIVQEHFHKRLGCEVDILYLLNKKVSRQEMEEKVFGTDIIYVGGGNTLKMMNIWRKIGLDKILLEAVNKGIVLSGVSAGAICWFRYGSSDSRRFTNPEADLIRVRGLGLIPILLCPHYDVEVDRKANLKDLMKKTSGVAIAVENCCAVEIVNDQYKIIESKPTANAYKVYWQQGKYVEERIEKTNEFAPLQELLLKSRVR